MARRGREGVIMKKPFFQFALAAFTLAAAPPQRSAGTQEPATTAKPLSYTTTWLGNRFGGGKKWVQNFAEGMFVARDGTVYLASGWDEGGREFGFYRNSDVVGQAADTHGWGTGGGVAVAANDRYIFLAHAQGNEGGHLTGEAYPAKGKIWFGVSRRNKDGSHAPFSGGRGRFKDMLVLHEENDGTDAQARGLACDGQLLYVSDYAANQIRVYAAETMALVRSWPFLWPTGLALDADNNLWALQSGHWDSRGVKGPAPGLFRFTPGRKTADPLLAGATLPVYAVPTAFCVDHHTNRLLVADGGRAQQILIYDTAGTQPKLVGTLGGKGGMFGGNTPGKAGPLRFAGLSGVGVDAAGNVYVAGNTPAGGTILRSFTPDGKKMRWELLGLEFVDTADAIPDSDGTDVYTTEGRYTLDWTKTAPGSQWTWRAHTLDPFRFPNDPRLTEGHHNLCAPLVRTLGGQRFLVVRGMFQHALVFYKLGAKGAGEIAKPSAMFSKGPYEPKDWKAPQPKTGRWMWRDANDDGDFQASEFGDADGVRDDESWAWWVDENGGLWQGQQNGENPIRYFAFGGLDKAGNPVYRRATMKTFALPTPMNHLLRIEYLPKTDTMYLTGHTTDRPKTGNEWGQVGSEVLRFDDWSKGNRTPRYHVPLPYQPETAARFPGASVTNATIKSFCTADDRLFAVESRTAKVHVYDANTGAKLGEMSPGPEVANESGWVDFPDAIRATRRKNGEYLVFVEEDAKGKVIVYRLKG